MREIRTKLRPFIKTAVLGGTLFFVAKALKDHWQEVLAIRLAATGWACLAIALGITLLAHIWSGWVWSLILRDLGQPMPGTWGVLVYLKTNIAKYLPGNVWHFYGRVSASCSAGLPMPIAIVSVLMEPLLMVAAALAIALLSSFQQHGVIQLVSLVAILFSVHPWIFNRLLHALGRWRKTQINAAAQRYSTSPTDKDTSPDPAPDIQPTPRLQVKRYPLIPFLGEVAFVGLRGLGFILVVAALQPTLTLEQIPLLLSAFSIAWLLGVVVPGSPGGLGIFEVTAIALLSQSGESPLPTAIILSAVALYRLISTLAEAGGAGLAWLDDYQSQAPMV